MTWGAKDWQFWAVIATVASLTYALYSTGSKAFSL